MQAELTKARTVPALPEVSPAKWQQVLAGSLFHSGLLRVMQRFLRTYEWQADGAKLRPRWRKISSPKFVILCYHRIGTGGIPLYSSVPPEIFEAQMRYLRKRYRLVSLEALCTELENPDRVEHAVAVTFDDGYRDTYTHAFPILQKYQVPVTIFTTVGSIETGQVPWYDRVFLALQVARAETLELNLGCVHRWELSSPVERLRAALDLVARLRTLPDRQRKQCQAELEKHVRLPENELAERMLTWEQIREMHRAGIAFGSHTMTHPVVSRLEPAELESELVESKRILEEKLGSPVKDFAYPFGQPADCGSEVAKMLAQCGYRSAVTTVRGINQPAANLYGLRRVQIGEQGSLAMFACKLNQAFFSGAGESDRLVRLDTTAARTPEGVFGRS